MLKISLSTALKKSMQQYSVGAFFCDIKAGFVVSLVSLPLSMALSIAIGLPPQHGLYTAIVAGIVVPLLGGSKFQISGPTAAFVVILAPIVSEYGLRGLIWCQIIAGFILLIMGISRMGKFINHMPESVTLGFTAGIAIVILTLSLKDFFGLNISSMPDSYYDKLTMIISHLNSFKLPEFIIGLTTLVLLIFSGKFIKIIPSPIIAIVVATIISHIFHIYSYAEIMDIGNKFSYVNLLGQTIKGIPPYLPHIHIPGISSSDIFKLPNKKEFYSLLGPSFVIALLAGLESLLSATIADSMTGKKHDPNAELNAIGIGNIITAMFSGIPATGAIARTATGINAGAKSPVASVIHSTFLLLYVFSLSKIVSLVPMASLSAMLFYTAIKMSQIDSIIGVFKSKKAKNKIVLIISLLLTSFIDMVIGVASGIIIHWLLNRKRN